MNFKTFIPGMLAVLGISEFKAENGRKVLSAEEKETLTKAGFPAKFVEEFEAALNEPETTAAENPTARTAAVSAILGQVTTQLTETNAALESARSQSAVDAATIAAKEKEIATLKERIGILAAAAEPAQGAPAANVGTDLANEEQLAGMPGVMYSLQDRPYNQRARASMLARQGKIVPVAAESSADYSSLREDLGAFYRQSWSERLQSLLAMLPSVESIFPVESGYQDLATLVNVWLGEFSQADNTINSDFDNVVKGKYDFGTETLRMYSVMFAHKFRDLKQVERTWIGFLNREGSNSIKMSFVEFLLGETAKKLQNEREQRRINGVRRNPVANTPGQSLEAADGLYEYIRKKIDGHIDFTPDGGTTGKTVYQIKPFNLPKITAANIGDVIYQGTSMVPSHIRDTGNLVLYIPSHLVPLYHKYNEAKYGVNQDYAGKEMFVHEFPGVKLIPVPNADNHNRLIWTLNGNIKCYELVAGEMLNFRIEQQDWCLKVYSQWTEGLAAQAVGYKYTDRNAMDGSRQLIWVNDEDMPESFYLKGRPDQNPSALLHTSVETVPNGSLYEITDIEGAEVGKAVAIRCGADGSVGVTIKKAGKFELINSDWLPVKGEVIRLMKRADGKFIELGRDKAVDGAYMFAADDTTPDVSGATTFVVGLNTKATAITDLVNAEPGTVYTIHGNGDTNASTIANSGKFALTAAMTLKTGTFIQVVKAEDGKFYEVSRVAAKA